MNVDGAEITFEPIGDGDLRVIAEGHEVGTLRPSGERRGFIAFRRDGEPLRRPSQWGGPVTARFATRELAVRALLGD